ncbi:MAG: magnesium/cobalt transporter CorA [Chitinophagales bacterium]|nr:magnesium/cobalt transporter CorA [Chitinophagales bacterium]
MSKEHIKVPGAPPGSLIYTGDHKSGKPELTLIQYRHQVQHRFDADNWPAIAKHWNPELMNWINVDGLHDTQLIQDIGTHFDISSLVLEDVLSVRQLPKYENHEHFLFITLEMLILHPKTKIIEAEQFSIIFGKNYVLSFQEAPGDLFESIRQRIFAGQSKICGTGPDYLVYRLLDVIVDHYYVVIESVADEVTALELELLNKPNHQVMKEIIGLKRKLMTLRKFIHPLREALRNFYNDETELVNEHTSVYIADVMDHVNQIVQDVEVQRDILTGFTDLYNSAMSTRMNNIMKTLTVITTIFIPLTFIVGVYGMNFKHMPELEWYYGYPTVLVVLIIMAIGMAIYMKRKDWL